MASASGRSSVLTVWTYENVCEQLRGVLGIEATGAAIMKELRGVIEFDGSYINYRPYPLFQGSLKTMVLESYFGPPWTGTSMLVSPFLDLRRNSTTHTPL
jgi:hypothetical protein